MIKLQSADGYKIYTFEGVGSSSKTNKNNKNNCETTRDTKKTGRLELVQDLSFPSSCQKLKLSADGNFLIGSGLHSPRIRCFDLSHFSLKFERFLDSEVVDFQIISEDYSKIVLLCRDQSVQLLNRSGSNFNTHFPRPGRDLTYLPFAGELVVVGNTSEIFRLNLVEGRFLAPLISHAQAINACGYSPSKGLFACAGEYGILECFDMRAPQSLGHVEIESASETHKDHLTSLRFDDDGIHLAVGTSSGKIVIYDLRSSTPYLIKKHMFSLPIIDIKYQTTTNYGPHQRMIASTDANIVKFWDKNSGKTCVVYTSVIFL